MSDAPKVDEPHRLQRIGTWCARHSLVVILVWLVGLGVLQGLQSSFGGTYSNNFSLPGSQSSKGLDVLNANAPAIAGYSSQVVLHDSAPLTGFQTQINQTVANLQKLPKVTSVQSPIPASAGQPATALSADKQIGYITIRFSSNPSTFKPSYVDSVDTAVLPLRNAGVEVEYGGPLGELARPAESDYRSEAIGFLVAVVVLLIGFGSAIAAGLPLVAALVSVIAGVGALGLLAATATFATVAPTLATMIGLGVGIDYALFMITRHRQQLINGVEPTTAAGRAAATSGHAVLVSGTTVIIALIGLWVSRLVFIGLLGVAAGVTVITAVLGALTLVPALLGAIGTRIDRYHVRRVIAEETPAAVGDNPGGLYRYAATLAKHPAQFLVVGLVVIGVLAIPLFSLRLNHIDDGADPTSFTDRRAFDLISEGFGPGANGPFTLVVDMTSVPAADQSALQANVKKALTDVPGAASVKPPTPAGNGKVLVGTAVPDQRPQAASTKDLFKLLREKLLPQGVAGTSATTYVAGNTGASLDFVDIMDARLPEIIAVVVALAFLIILAVFRGLLVALKAAVLNLISIAAAYGVLVAVFQWGWGGPGLGVAGKVPIESYVPMIMFAIIFGLSMDYEVFLLSRVHEFWKATGDAKGAVQHALRITARVITCAALIMCSVFAAFILSDNVVVKMLGLGLAASVLIDATVVRLLLVPSVLTLLGKYAWWSPRWLDRMLPHIDAEGGTAP